MESNVYTTQDTAYNEELIKLQKKADERRSLRGRCISTGLLCIICIAVFYITAIILTSIAEEAISGTIMQLDNRYSLIPDMLINGIVSLVGFGIVGLIFCKATSTDVNEIFPHQHISFKKLAAVVAVGFTMCISANYIAAIFEIDLNIFGLETTYKDSLTGSTSILEHIVYFIAVAFVPAVAEEFVFRGCILGRLRKYGDGFALIISSILFGIMHGNLSQAPFAFVVGLATGWAVIYTGSIIPAMLIHFSNNFISVLADILFENFERNHIDTAILDIIFISLYIIVFALSLLAVYKLSKNDSNFAGLKPYQGELSFKERIKIFTTSATVIIFFVLMIAECLFTLQVIE